MAPEAFGEEYKTTPSHSFVKQLKREGTAHTSAEIANVLHDQLRMMGVTEEQFSLSVELIKPILPDKDPQTIFVHYASLYEENVYLTDNGFSCR